DGKLVVTDCDELLLLTRIGRYGKNAQTEWGKKLIQDQLSAIDYDYDALLARQKAAHGEIYARATMDYNAPEADRVKSNEELIAMQKASGNPVLAYFERLYDAGRYHYLSSSGDLGPPDLLGIWAGDCEVGWSGYYHLDANLNLQISGAVIGNMHETIEGYTWLNEAWVPGFQTNATKLLGCRGTLGGGNTPGASSGLISALSYYYPYQYVTGEMSWLMQPIWEYYQATGDVDFLRDRLYPMMKEIGYFYEDFLKLKDTNGKWVFAGSISPESQPSGVPYSLVNNSSFDISGAKWGLETLIKICDILDDDADGQKAVWQSILDDLPPLLINNVGALAEWSWPSLADRNAYQHRHSSGMIGVWPYRDITRQKTPELAAAAHISLQRKDSGNYENAGHGLLHGAMIASKLNDADSATAKLVRMASDFFFNGLNTDHYDKYATFCTDVVNSFYAVQMEMTMSSDEGGDGQGPSLELLPAMPKSIPSGTVKGLRARNQITVDEITWNRSRIQAKITSAVDQTITLIQHKGIKTISASAEVRPSALGDTAREITLKKGETATIDLTTQSVPEYKNIAVGKTATASTFESSTNDYHPPAHAVDGNTGTRWASQPGQNNQWLQIDLGNPTVIHRLQLLWEAAYGTSYYIETSVDGASWTEVYRTTTGTGGTEVIPLPENTVARYVKFTGLTRATQYGFSLWEFMIEQLGAEDENDASLFSLAVNPGTLAPVFNAETLNYTVSLPPGTGSVTVSAAAYSADATVSGTGVIPLQTGANTVPVTVTAQDGVTNQTYTIIVTVGENPPPDTDASLVSLAVSPGILTPAFDPEILAYSVALPAVTGSITVSALSNSKDATVAGSGVVALQPGHNTVPVTVTAGDGVTIRTYMVVVIVEEPLPLKIIGDVNTNGEVDIGDARMILQYLVQKITLTEIQKDLADVDGKDGVTITDARLVLQYLVDKIDR
ncbi:MAG: discoidin domain-containing protein, partial [Oscillospiraceae bacterium]|nr:discoidin domain-containing protein [Oscillospiraceae bacterium]